MVKLSRTASSGAACPPYYCRVQMGSSGATICTQSVIYSLATLENVDCVYFDIREGNHAGPGKHRPLGD